MSPISLRLSWALFVIFHSSVVAAVVNNASSSMELLSGELPKVVIIMGLVDSNVELNGQVALVTAFDEHKERYETKLMNHTRVLLRSHNLQDWAALEVPLKEDFLAESARLAHLDARSRIVAVYMDHALERISMVDGMLTKHEGREAKLAEAVEAKYLTEAEQQQREKDTPPSRLLTSLRAGLVRSAEGGVAQDLYQKFMKIGWTSEGPHEPYLRELLGGGAIEMVVQSLEAHYESRERLFFALFSISQILTDQNEDELSLANEARGRAVDAGVFEKLSAALEAQTTNDVHSSVLSVFASTAGGGAFPSTEARRSAAAAAGGLPAIISAMTRHSQSSAVQHFGISAIGTICAMGVPSGKTGDSTRTLGS